MTALPLLLTGFGKSLIYQYRLLSVDVSGFDPAPRQDSAVLVVFLQRSGMNEELYMLEAFLFVCILKIIAQGMKVNKISDTSRSFDCFYQ